MGEAEALEDLHDAIADLVKLYQFRNRDELLYYGVTVAQAYALRALWRHGPLSMSALARELSIPVSTLTGVIDQLEARRLVRRRADPEDRRSFVVALSAAGRKLYEQGNDEFRRRLRGVAKRFDARELESVRAFLADFGAMVADWREARS